MGWLFGCFGGSGRRDRLPRLCSKSSRHHRGREHVKAQPRISPFATALGSGRPMLRNDEPYVHQNPSLQFPGVGNAAARDGLQNKLDARRNTKDVGEIWTVEEEVCHLRSCGISLQSAAELHKVEFQAPSYLNISKIQNGSPTVALESVPDQSAASIMLETQSSTDVEETSLNALQEQRSIPRSSGFFVLPKTRGSRYKSFVWQEPLSPVAEAESSISSEDDANRDKLASVVPDSSPSDCKMSPSSKGEISDVEITPVSCTSPIIERSPQRGNSGVEKENLFPGRLGITEQGRETVLTPVGNLLQWRQLKEPARELCTSEKVSPSGSDAVEVDPDNYTFFKELQLSSTEITPQRRPSRWGDPTVLGIPNTTRKYKEDQKVVWHSTPFEVRLDRALAKHL